MIPPQTLGVLLAVSVKSLRFPTPVFSMVGALDVHFISALPVVQRTVCKAWAETRPVQIAWAESSTMPAHDVVDDAFACMASLTLRVDLSTSNDTDGRDGCWRPRESHTGGCQNRRPHRHRLV